MQRCGMHTEVIEVLLEPKGSGLLRAGVCVLPLLMCCKTEGKGPLVTSMDLD